MRNHTIIHCETRCERGSRTPLPHDHKFHNGSGSDKQCNISIQWGGTYMELVDREKKELASASAILKEKSE